jgi:hypothetical protein
MNRRKFIVGASCTAALLQPTRSIAAPTQYDSQPSSITRLIATKTTLTQPHFYYVAGGISIFVPPDFVSQHGHAYVPIVMSAAPLHDHTDILRGFVLGNNHPLDVLFILADALEAGVALVHDMERGVTVSQVKLIKVNSGSSGSRDFLLSDDDGGGRIFFLTDWIA